jgi:Family of unknown function (DUF5677)
MSELLSLGDFDYSSRVVDEASLLKAESEEPFAREAFECLKELVQSVVITAGLHRMTDEGRVRRLTRDEAILAGLMVRCAKLQFGLLSASAERHMELLNFFTRGIVETAVNLRFLLEHGTPDVFQAFVVDSLKVDKRLRQRIAENVEARGGARLPIEERMLTGIDRAFQTAGVTPDEVDPDARGPWSKGGVWGRFKALGLEDAYIVFQTQSHYIHGNWHDLYAYHLEVDDSGTFVPDVEFGEIRPHPLLTAIVVTAGAATAYLRAVAPESDERTVLEDRMNFCVDKAQLIDRRLEDFVQRRAGRSAPAT